MTWAQKARKKPYTKIGIKRVRCVRCNAKAVHQWSVCADGNGYRALCLECDIALNKLVLEWANDHNAAAKVAAYEAQQRLAES